MVKRDDRQHGRASNIKWTDEIGAELVRGAERVVERAR
jgi:hypothetical protein